MRYTQGATSAPHIARFVKKVVFFKKTGHFPDFFGACGGLKDPPKVGACGGLGTGWGGAGGLSD